MINRDIIRTKVVELVYAYYLNSNAMETVEKELLFSLSKAYHLYNHMLALIVAVSRESKRVYDIEVQGAQREGRALPSDRFVNNRFALQLEENIQLREFMETQKPTWDEDYEAVTKLFQQMVASEPYQLYINGADLIAEDQYEVDREIWRKLYKLCIEQNEELDAIIEPHSLYWNDDKEIVDTFVLKTIKRFDPANGSEQELLPEYKDIDDRDFALKLFRNAIMHGEEYQQYMSDASRNWDFSRLAYMDIVIMQIAIAEMLTFPAVPVSVTINEYVDLAKLYSTPQSGKYINGMLDAIARHLHKGGVLRKPLPEPRNNRNNN